MTDFDEWVKSDNVYKFAKDLYIEHTTQWNKHFTLAELKEFYKREYL